MMYEDDKGDDELIILDDTKQKFDTTNVQGLYDQARSEAIEAQTALRGKIRANASRDDLDA